MFQDSACGDVTKWGWLEVSMDRISITLCPNKPRDLSHHEVLALPSLHFAVRRDQIMVSNSKPSLYLFLPSYSASQRFPGTAIASRFKAFRPPRIQIADTMPQVIVQMTIITQRPKSSGVNSLNPSLSINLLKHSRKLSVALIRKWAVMALRSSVRSVMIKRIKLMIELRYVTVKASARAITRNSGTNSLRVEMVVIERVVVTSSTKTIERRGDMSDVPDDGLAGMAMLALQSEQGKGGAPDVNAAAVLCSGAVPIE